MCRFLIIKSKNKIKLTTLLNQFATMCQNSRSPDGDWQGDGFGIAWKDNGKWNLVKSLQPIWQSDSIFSQISETHLLVAHARSAGFPQHKGNIEHNQPYIGGDLCFVFNGMLRGVKLSISLEGSIGAQKIFSLIKNLLTTEKPDFVLKKVDDLLLANTAKVEGMNIGIVSGNSIHILCEYIDQDKYFGTKYYQDDTLTLFCSQSIGDYQWQTMKKGEIINL